MLEIGCGIGRIESAFAPHVRFAVGVDIASEMLRTARRRCARDTNVAFVQTSGRGLEPFADASFDLVIAVDSFPYLVRAGESIAEHHVFESARVLRAGGDLVLFNYSYRHEPARDAADITRAATEAGFRMLRANVRPFRTWDAVGFHARRRSP